MSPRSTFNDQLEAWLDEGPLSAPREDLAAVLEEIPRIPQRRSVGPWRITMPTFVRLAVAAALVVAVGAFALTRLGSATGPSAGTQPTPTPGWAQRFPTQTASTFVQPFRYAMDPTLGFEVDVESSRSTFRIPGSPGPVAVLDRIEQLRLDPCHETGGRVETQPTARGFVDYMRTVPGLRVTPLPDATIDGRSALGVDVARTPNPACADVWLFGSGDSFTCCWPDDPTWVRRMWALDIDGELITITTPFGSGSKDAELRVANSFVDTIHFLVGPGASAVPTR